MTLSAGWTFLSTTLQSLPLSSDAFSISVVIPLSTNLISQLRKRHDKKLALCLLQCCYSVCILLLNAAALYSSAVRRAKWNLTWFAFMLGAHIAYRAQAERAAFHVICADALHFQMPCTSLRSFFTRPAPKEALTQQERHIICHLANGNARAVCEGVFWFWFQSRQSYLNVSPTYSTSKL